MSGTPKFAPADSVGNKPYVRRCREFRWDLSTIVYAKDARDAKYAFRIGRYETVDVRRATVDDVAALHVEAGRAAVVDTGEAQKGDEDA